MIEMAELPLQGSDIPRELRLTSKVMSGLHLVGEGVAELLWPTRCVLCDVPGTLLCERCRLSIPYIDALRACSYCGQAHGRYACLDCNSFIVRERGLNLENKIGERIPVLDQIVSVFPFEGAYRKLITTFKDRKEIRLAAELAKLLTPYIDPAWIIPRDTALVVIPTRKQALKERGFDHMKEIGSYVSEACGLPLVGMLETNESIDQRGLSAEHRSRNMHNSFTGRMPLRVFENVILIDDVLTTGATLLAGASILNELGVRRVFGLTLARLP